MVEIARNLLIASQEVRLGEGYPVRSRAGRPRDYHHGQTLLTRFQMRDRNRTASESTLQDSPRFERHSRSPESHRPSGVAKHHIKCPESYQPTSAQQNQRESWRRRTLLGTLQRGRAPDKLLKQELVRGDQTCGRHPAIREIRRIDAT